ncbi:hypothetical protein N665_0400s0053 [Sinapis alba]|nr:hypothetical protein N665_0400s0053 [Sinapis alba]
MKISILEKGKSVALKKYEPPKAARVVIDRPNNTDLLCKHSLTLIGYFGTDVRNGMFKFRFELESDLLSVLDKCPYHFARWMVTFERWEPTLSPKFRSTILLWIKVQQEHIPHEMLKREMGELPEVMTQYTNYADPTESAVRKEQFRKYEEEGQIEEYVLQAVRAALLSTPNVVSPEDISQKTSAPLRLVLSQERIPSSQILGIVNQVGTTSSMKALFEEWILATQRLRVVIQEETISLVKAVSQERIPATLRLGDGNQEGTTPCCKTDHMKEFLKH